MSWLFSRALVGDCLGRNRSDLKPSALLSWIGTADAFLHSDKMKDTYEVFSQYGMTFVPLTAERGAEELMLYLEGFLANLSAQHRGAGKQRSICGPKCTE